MKFVLNEDSKFLLSEKSTFTLEERFILSEDALLLEAQATLKQLAIDLTKIDTLLPELITVLPIGLNLEILEGTLLDGTKLEIEEAIRSDCQSIQELVTTKHDLKELINKMQPRAQSPEATNSFTEDQIAILQPLCYSITSDGNSIKDRLKSIKNHKGNLAEQVVALQERLPVLKANLEKLYKLSEDGFAKYSLKKDVIKLKVGDTFTLKVLATPKPEKPIKVTFTSSDESIATIDPTGIITAKAEGNISITAAVADQVLKGQVIVKAAAEINWEELYKRCSNCTNRKEAYAAFWNGGLPRKGQPNPKELPVAATEKLAAGYFKGEWGKQAGLIRSLGSDFTNSLTKFG
jgi:hypothetical protein